MSDPEGAPPYYSGRLYRLLTAGFGALLFVLGIYVALVADISLFWRVAAGLVLMLVGGNAVSSAATGRESWLSRIGPLP